MTDNWASPNPPPTPVHDNVQETKNDQTGDN